MISKETLGKTEFGLSLSGVTGAEQYKTNYKNMPQTGREKAVKFLQVTSNHSFSTGSKSRGRDFPVFH